MKKKLLLLLPFLLLAGCGNTTPSGDPTDPTDPGVVDPTDPTDPTDPSEPVDPTDPTDPVDPTDPTDPVDPTEPEEEEESDCKLKSISINPKELILELNERQGLIVDYVSTEELDFDAGEKDVAWESLDSSIATVDQYGRVKGVSVGNTVIVCTSVLGSRKARCNVTVVASKADLKYEYQRVDDPSTLKEKDTIVLAAYNDNQVASIETKSSKLFGDTATFSSNGDKLLSFGENTAQYYLGDNGERGFTLEAQNGMYLAGFNLERMGYVKNKGNIDWKFTLYEGNLYIKTYNDVRGWIMFNKDLNERTGGFTLYEREEANDYIYFPTIYRLTLVKGQ